MKTGARMKSVGARSQDSGRGIRKPGCWMVMLALILAAGCAAPKAQFTDEEWVSHSATGRGCYERGDFRRASDAYARAAQRAQAMDDANALAVSAVNRSVCLLAEGKPEVARMGVAEALADARVSKGRRAELQVAGSRAELSLMHPEKAKEFAMAALKLDPPASLRAQALLVQSAAELAMGDSAQASKTLSKGLSDKAWGRLPAAIRAELAVRQAEIDAAENRPSEAAARQEAAAALWRKADRLPEMAQALAAAGRLSQASGQLSVACDQFYRAARSQWAQGLHQEAIATLEEGVGCAEELKDEETSLRMAELAVTFKNETRLEN